MKYKNISIQVIEKYINFETRSKYIENFRKEKVARKLGCRIKMHT